MGPITTLTGCKEHANEKVTIGRSSACKVRMRIALLCLLFMPLVIISGQPEVNSRHLDKGVLMSIATRCGASLGKKSREDKNVTSTPEIMTADSSLHLLPSRVLASFLSSWHASSVFDRRVLWTYLKRSAQRSHWGRRRRCWYRRSRELRLGKVHRLVRWGATHARDQHRR